MYDRHGVGAGAAIVALGLDLGRAVNVADHQSVRMLLFGLAQLLGRDHIGHGAAGRWLGHEHLLLQRKNGGRLGHETHAAEDDHCRVRFGRLDAQPQRIATEIRQVLNLRRLIIVRQDHGVALYLEFLNVVEKSRVQNTLRGAYRFF